MSFKGKRHSPLQTLAARNNWIQGFVLKTVLTGSLFSYRMPIEFELSKETMIALETSNKAMHKVKKLYAQDIERAKKKIRGEDI